MERTIRTIHRTGITFPSERRTGGTAGYGVKCRAEHRKDLKRYHVIVEQVVLDGPWEMRTTGDPYEVLQVLDTPRFSQKKLQDLYDTFFEGFDFMKWFEEHQ